MDFQPKMIQIGRNMKDELMSRLIQLLELVRMVYSFPVIMTGHKEMMNAGKELLDKLNM
jgi:hypothetical protein